MKTADYLEKASGLARKLFIGTAPQAGILDNIWFVVIFFTGLGLAESYFTSAMTGFGQLPGDVVDGRFNHYLLEHSWLWLTGNELHAQFWDAPFFYPLKNVMGFSDVLLGAAPIYWLFRLLGMDYNNSYLLWYGCLGVLNWAAMWLFIKKGFSLDNFSAGAGAFLFAFCAPRLYAAGHIQLWTQFWTPLFLLCLIVFYRNRDSDALKARVALCLAALCFTLQFYAAFYLGMFLAIGCIAYATVSLINRQSRAILLPLLKRGKFFMSFCGVMILVMLLPLADHYIQAKAYFGALKPWLYSTVHPPLVPTWFNTPSYLYAHLANRTMPMSVEHMMGIGFLTFFLAIAGLLVGFRGDVARRNFLWAILALFLMCSVSIGGFEIFKLLWLIPGVSALRAVSRIFFLFLVPLALGYAFLMNHKKLWVQILLAVILIGENLAESYVLTPKERDAEIVSQIAEIAREHPLPFLYLARDKNDVTQHLDAMWASIKSGRPTINGYSSRFTHKYSNLLEGGPEGVESADYPPVKGMQFLLIYNDGDKLSHRTVN